MNKSLMLLWVNFRLGVSVRLLSLIDELLAKSNHGVESDFSIQSLFDLSFYLWLQVRTCSVFNQFLVIRRRRLRVKMNLLLLFQIHSREIDQLFAFSRGELAKKSHGNCSKLFDNSYQVKFCGDWMPCLIVYLHNFRFLAVEFVERYTYRVRFGPLIPFSSFVDAIGIRLEKSFQKLAIECTSSKRTYKKS